MSKEKVEKKIVSEGRLYDDGSFEQSGDVAGILAALAGQVAQSSEAIEAIASVVITTVLNIRGRIEAADAKMREHDAARRRMLRKDRKDRKADEAEFEAELEAETHGRL